MGNCCSNSNPLEDSIADIFGKMNTNEIQLTKAKDILNHKIGAFTITDDMRNKFSNKALAALQNSYVQISKDNFMEICKTNFFIPQEIQKWKYETQKLFFEKIYEVSKNNKTMIILYLLPYLKGYDDNKLEVFYSLLLEFKKTDKIQYSFFKVFLFEYVAKTLQLPLMSIEEALKQNGKNEEIEHLNLEEALTNVNKTEYIHLFLERIFDNFEMFKFPNEHDMNQIENYTLQIEDVYHLLSEHKYYLFNVFKLRHEFLINLKLT